MKLNFASMLLFFLCVPAVDAKESWPLIENVDSIFNVPEPNKRIYIELPLKDAAGKTQYTLFCRGGKEPYLSNGAPKDLFLVEPFACRLNEGDKENESTLLSEDGSPYWHTRGRVASYNELLGACGNYPEFGRVRHFRLRGFELTLEFDEIVTLSETKISSFALRVVIKSDTKIVAKKTERPGYLSPNGDCENIRKGNPKLMCRSTKPENLGSWEECSVNSLGSE